MPHTFCSLDSMEIGLDGVKAGGKQLGVTRFISEFLKTVTFTSTANSLGGLSSEPASWRWVCDSLICPVEPTVPL